jgi:hypothetical protein
VHPGHSSARTTADIGSRQATFRSKRRAVFAGSPRLLRVAKEALRPAPELTIGAVGGAVRPLPANRDDREVSEAVIEICAAMTSKDLVPGAYENERLCT